MLTTASNFLILHCYLINYTMIPKKNVQYNDVKVENDKLLHKEHSAIVETPRKMHVMCVHSNNASVPPKPQHL